MGNGGDLKKKREWVRGKRRGGERGLKVGGRGKKVIKERKR